MLRSSGAHWLLLTVLAISWSFGSANLSVDHPEVKALIAQLATPGASAAYISTICNAISQLTGTDYCASLGLTPPKPSPPAPSPGSLCAAYNFADQDDNSTVFAFVNEALNVDRQGCFAALTVYCELSYSSPQTQEVAFTNWIDSLQQIRNYLQTPDAVLVGPNCDDALTDDEALRRLTGTDPVEGAPCPEFPSATAETPLFVNHTANGIVGPVRNQAGRTCYLQAATSFLQSLVLANGYTDLSGTVTLTNTTILSPQPVVDCAEPQGLVTGDLTDNSTCDGGYPTNATLALKTFPAAANNRYPYLNDSNGKDVLTQCQFPGFANNCSSIDPLSASYSSRGLFKIPQNLNPKTCRLSQSQLIQALATQGPFPVTYSAGNLADNYIPYLDAANTQKNILRGALLTKEQEAQKVSGICASANNHAVLAVGYDLRNPEEAYIILQNSWGTDHGDLGYFYYGLSDPSSAEFQDANFTAACGLNRGVTAYTFT